MSDTPFLERAEQISLRLTYEEMAKSAYSASWWRKLVRYGPWGDRDQIHPPTVDKLDGIAQLFRTTRHHVAQMIALDWYGVQVGIGFSARVKRLIPLIDGLSDRDATLIESLLLRLSGPVRRPSPFQDTAQEIADSYGYPYTQTERWDLVAQRCDNAYSASWWRKLVRDGPWDGGLPPAYDKLDAIADMFETTPEHVAQMIVVDWYGVQAGIAAASPRVEGFIPMIDHLSDEDLARVRSLLRRLSQDAS